MTDQKILKQMILKIEESLNNKNAEKIIRVILADDKLKANTSDTEKNKKRGDKIWSC